MTKKFLLPRGTNDILPSDIHPWLNIEQVARRICKLYNYAEIRTPVFEESELFVRSVGQTSDIVLKQMLNLASQRKGENESTQLSGLSLRPENTASVVRSYIQNGLDRKESLTKVFYIGPMFRGERPQKGRLRQFHQIGVEAIGPQSSSPFLDAEVISLCVVLLDHLNIKGYQLEINTLGSQEDKARFADLLKEQLCNHKSALCDDCQLRFDRNVFRILDCKQKSCQKIVHGLNINYQYLASESLQYYQQVKKYLQRLNIPYTESPYLVRGLDYYTHTVFEITFPALGSQNALGAGGRYNNLVEQLGGPSCDATGFALGVERLLLAQAENKEINYSPLDLYMIGLNEACQQASFILLNQLRHQNISGEMSFRLGSLKSQMRSAHKSGALWVAILGEEEMKKSEIILKNMSSGFQETVKQSDILQYLQTRSAA